MAYNLEKTGDLFGNIQSSYFDYKLSVFQKYIYILILVASLINLMLLLPDLTLIESTISKISITIIRVAFSIMLLGVCFRNIGIKTFKQFSIIMSICEIIALAIFLFVLSQYSRPNFLIQTMGIITMIIIVFLAPNRWANMIFIAVFGAIGFFICTLIFIKSVNILEFYAVIVYVSIVILLCAISARNTEKHQYREFIAKRELEHISSTDYLTDTANRFKMEDEAGRWMDFCQRQGLPLSVVFIDVDNLKIVNDRYGHSIGDSVLANLAKLIQNQLRSSDILARWGGDEFIMLLPNATLDHAIDLSERIKNYIKESTFIKGINITCSFGVVEMKEDSNFKMLISEADKLMYKAKKYGKDNVQCN